jgi:iron complex transport system substrate-binding protein
LRPSRRTALATLAALALASCRGRSNAPGARRIVSLAPSTTEAVFALGAGAELVGRSRHCDYPPEAAALPAVGGYADPSVEAIVALAPTLVVGARGPAGPALEQALHGRGLSTFWPETESLAQIESMLADLGRLLDREAAGVAAAAVVRDRVGAISRAVTARPKVRAVLLFDVAPIVAAGPGGFPDELLGKAGADNLVKEGGAYPTLPVERLLALDPDVVLDGSIGAHQDGSRMASLRDAPGWRELRAMRSGSVRAVSDAVVLRPGPRIGEGLAILARALHGAAVVP